MEIRHLVTFKKIVDLGGFTKAADHLGYAQSTITTHIKALEDELKRPLFDRIGRNVVLTESGRNLLPQAIKMLELYNNIKEDVISNGEITGKIVISIGESLLLYRFPPIIEEYRRKYPKVNIEWHHLDSLNFKQELLKGNSDIVFMLGTEVNDANIYSEKLKDEPMMFLYPNDFNFNDQNNLNQSNLLFTEKGCSYRTLFEEFIAESKMVTTRNIEFWSIEAVKQSIISGLGISILPRITVERELRENKLNGEVYKRSLSTYLMYPKNKWLSPALDELTNIVRAHAMEW